MIKLLLLRYLSILSLLCYLELLSHWFHSAVCMAAYFQFNSVHITRDALTSDRSRIQLKIIQKCKTYLFTAERMLFTTLCYYEWWNAHTVLLRPLFAKLYFYQLVINSFLSSRHFFLHWFQFDSVFRHHHGIMSLMWFPIVFCCCFSFVKHFPTVNNVFSCIVMLPHLKLLFHFMWLTIRELVWVLSVFQWNFDPFCILSSGSSKKRNKMEWNARHNDK